MGVRGEGALAINSYLGEVGGLAGLVLRHLVKGVLAALLPLAEGLSLLGHVDHCN